MSYEIKIKLYCDGCGEVFKNIEEFRKTRVKESIWGLDIEAQRKGWFMVSRGMYNTQGHYCHKMC